MSLSTSIQPAEFDFENIDISVLRAARPDPGFHCVPVFVEDDLAAGRLVAPFPHVFPTGRRYFLISPDTRRHAQATAHFLRWISDQGNIGAQ